MLGKTLPGRLGRPEEVANVAMLLDSGENSFLTGVDIVVMGRRGPAPHTPDEGVVHRGAPVTSLATWPAW
jgi:hypothetical protein